jgi:hypothetical protein
MRALKILVVVMGVLIVGGVVLLGVLLTQRIGTMSGPSTTVALDEPAGTRIIVTAAMPDRVVLQLQGGGPDRVVVIDLRSGRVTGRIGLAR